MPLLHDVLGVRLVADDPSGQGIDLSGVAVVEFSDGFHVSTRIYGHAGSLDWLARGGHTGPGIGQYGLGSAAGIGGTLAIPRGTGVAHSRSLLEGSR